MKEITPGLPVKVVVDVLRQASKVNTLFISSITEMLLQRTSADQPCLMCVLQACVVKREFRKAEQLIKHAVFLAR